MRLAGHHMVWYCMRQPGLVLAPNLYQGVVDLHQIGE
jgi:hypothetical protein